MDHSITVIKQLISILESANVTFKDLTVRGIYNITAIINIAQTHIRRLEEESIQHEQQQQEDDDHDSTV